MLRRSRCWHCESVTGKLSEEITLFMADKLLLAKGEVVSGSCKWSDAESGNRKGMMEGDRDVGVWLERVVEGGWHNPK